MNQHSNLLQPEWTFEELLYLELLYKKYSNKWSKISRELEYRGFLRSPHAIKAKTRTVQGFVGNVPIV